MKEITKLFDPKLISRWLQEFGYRDDYCVGGSGLRLAIRERGTQRIRRELHKFHLTLHGPFA